MDTPICDFVEKYIKSDFLRLHMPGHKGKVLAGHEAGDITEIDGADSLYEADGIIYKSEQNASKLFGFHTYYSTEGSSLSIRAMLYLVMLYARGQGKEPIIAAGRNAHKVFLHAASLLDFDIQWIWGNGSYLSCNIEPDELDAMLSQSDKKPVAVYLTSPDYLGNVLDIAAISKVCHRHGVLLVVDNAHGAYLKFLEPSKHPIDLGADMCCDSAHKTLPTLTGGAYLHIANSAPEIFCTMAKNALSLFGSTSPSYLILQSLDMTNSYLADGYGKRLNEFALLVHKLKERLIEKGFCLVGNEPMKLTVSPKRWGYTGDDFAHELKMRNIVCEFADADFTVLMLTPEIGEEGLKLLEDAMNDIPQKAVILEEVPAIPKAKRVMSPKEAIFSQKEELPVRECASRVIASASVGCPPAVPIISCGEMIDEAVIECFKYYGIQKCLVVRK